jgi:hypothetical protein
MRIHLMKLAVTCAVGLAAGSLFFLENKVSAFGIDDSASAVRGSLGVYLEDLGLNGNLGESSFLLNGGFALLSVAFMCFAVAKRRRVSTSGRHHQHRRSADSVAEVGGQSMAGGPAQRRTGGPNSPSKPRGP